MLMPTLPQGTDAALVASFRNHAVPNDAKSKAEGRPIYDDIEVCDVRIPGSRNWQPFPAHSVSHWVTDPLTGAQMQVTYAERFRHQYQQFKMQQVQTKTGTPLTHAPFLTEARRSELRALNIYTVEQLAGIDGQELKNLGVGGREMKNAAQEYIDGSKANVPNLTMQAELEALRAVNEALAQDNEVLKKAQVAIEGEFADMTDEQIREYIKSQTGHVPQGNLSRKVLVRMATDARPNKAA